jgi:hypothetical protein
MMRAWIEGARRVNAAAAVLFGTFAITFLLALPLAIALRGMLEDHLGGSLAADTAAAGVNYDWWEEFAGQAVGLGTTFTPTIIGFAAVLQNLSQFADGIRPATTVAAAAGAYLFVWAFLAGGILDRYARNRPTRAAGFFSACGVYFFRFIRLGILAGFSYYVLFALVHPLLFVDLFEWLVRDITVERNAFAIRLGCYAIFAVLLGGVNLVFDYAKVRAVVEDRRSMIGALAAGFRFVRRRPVATTGLYLLCGAAYLAVLAAYALVAPGAGGTAAAVWLAFAIGQAYVLARLWVKLLFYASETAFFQSELAHAEFTAQPAVVWPESPAAEAIANAVKDRA